MENLSYVAGLNRIGTDGNGIPYNGHSAIYGPKGETLYDAADREEVHFQNIDLEILKAYRKKFPANLDADQFEIKG
jgi:predicted amidohydrolase